MPYIANDIESLHVPLTIFSLGNIELIAAIEKLFVDIEFYDNVIYFTLSIR
jgi:hypothetical protein